MNINDTNIHNISFGFKAYRLLWFALRENVSALDELEMCTMRLRLRFPGEKVEENQIHIINPIEVRNSFTVLTYEGVC